MTVVRKPLMTASEFLDWAKQQPGKWELFDGVPVTKSPQRVGHSDVKYRVTRALDAAIQKANAPCRFVLDSALVPIDKRRSFQPDVMVYCGPRVSSDALEIPNPVIVVEVLSPSTALYDLRDKLAGYFLVPSIMHYLIVDPDARLAIHHRRAERAIETAIVTTGAITLDPSGLELAFADLMPS